MIYMTDNRVFVDFDEEDEGEVIRMANTFLNVMSESDAVNPSVPASALGYALAVLMSGTRYPDMVFSAALNARDVQYKQLVSNDEDVPVIYNH